MKSADKKKKAKAAEPQVNFATLGGNLSFAAKEAYKLLRTNLAFILSELEDKRCHLIGVTSSIRGEGKSTTSINLACTLAEMNARVLLVEGDMRIPSLHNKLDMPMGHGLSTVLVSRKEPGAFDWQYITHIDNGGAMDFDVLLAGEIPPNPSELLGSARMKALMQTLSEYYDYIILDLPPVTAVTDALVATKLVDGLIVVVRSGHADRGSLDETMRQIQLVNGRVLGFVMTCANAGGGAYSKKYRSNYRYRYYQKDYK